MRDMSVKALVDRYVDDILDIICLDKSTLDWKINIGNNRYVDSKILESQNVVQCIF